MLLLEIQRALIKHALSAAFFFVAEFVHSPCMRCRRTGQQCVDRALSDRRRPPINQRKRPQRAAADETPADTADAEAVLAALLPVAADQKYQHKRSKVRHTSVDSRPPAGPAPTTVATSSAPADAMLLRFPMPSWAAFASTAHAAAAAAAAGDASPLPILLSPELLSPLSPMWLDGISAANRASADRSTSSHDPLHDGSSDDLSGWSLSPNSSSTPHAAMTPLYGEVECVELDRQLQLQAAESRARSARVLAVHQQTGTIEILASQLRRGVVSIFRARRLLESFGMALCKEDLQQLLQQLMWKLEDGTSHSASISSASGWHRADDSPAATARLSFSPPPRLVHLPSASPAWLSQSLLHSLPSPALSLSAPPDQLADSASSAAADLLLLHSLYSKLGQFRITHRNARFTEPEDPSGLEDQPAPDGSMQSASILLLSPGVSALQAAHAAETFSTSEASSSAGFQHASVHASGAAAACAAPASGPAGCVHIPSPSTNEEPAVVSNGWELSAEQSQMTPNALARSLASFDQLRVSPSATRLIGQTASYARALFRAHGFTRMIEYTHRADWFDAVYARCMLMYAQGCDDFCVHSVVRVNRAGETDAFRYMHMHVQHCAGDAWTRWRCSYTPMPGPIPLQLPRDRTLEEVKYGAVD